MSSACIPFASTALVCSTASIAEPMIDNTCRSWQILAVKKPSRSWEGSNLSAIVGFVQAKVSMQTAKPNLIQPSTETDRRTLCSTNTPWEGATLSAAKISLTAKFGELRIDALDQIASKSPTSGDRAKQHIKLATPTQGLTHAANVAVRSIATRSSRQQVRHCPL